MELALWDGLLRDGEVDFEAIGEGRLVGWLRRKGHWPDDMPPTLDLGELGLSEDDIERVRTQEEREATERDFQRRSIEFGGARYAGTPEDFAALADAVRQTIGDSLLKTRAGWAQLTAAMPPRERAAGGKRGHRQAKIERMTDAQRSAVGLAGEVVALEWLKRRYGGATDECWKSAYRDSVLGGARGDDSLGYDFEVPTGRTSYFFEVKATTGEQTQIELGESEIAAAQRHARGERYRILYIQNVLEPEHVRIHVLPNPFSARGRDVYRVVGSGLRYAFGLESG